MQNFNMKNAFPLAIAPEIAYNVFAKVKKFELYSYIRRYFHMESKRRFGDRKDGRLIQSLAPFYKFMP